VPSTNGSVTAAPVGGHNIQAGATEDAAAAADDAVVDDEVPALPVATALVAPDVDVDADGPAPAAEVVVLRAAAGPATATSSDSAIKNRGTIDLPPIRSVAGRQYGAKPCIAAHHSLIALGGEITLISARRIRLPPRCSQAPRVRSTGRRGRPA
jgi:hypothetical protein